MFEFFDEMNLPVFALKRDIHNTMEIRGNFKRATDERANICAAQLADKISELDYDILTSARLQLVGFIFDCTNVIWAE